MSCLLRLKFVGFDDLWICFLVAVFVDFGTSGLGTDIWGWYKTEFLWNLAIWCFLCLRVDF